MKIIKYSLDDKEKQERFKAIWPDFDEVLQAACLAEGVDPDGDTPLYLHMADGSTIRINTDRLDFEYVYDPNDWNAADLIEPPPYVWMRCERHFPSGEVERYCAQWARPGGYWSNDKGNRMPTPDRFRPWD